MPTEEMKKRLSGKEVIEITGFAIAYQANVKDLSGHYTVATITLGPKMIQADRIPEALHAPILSLINKVEREKWGLPMTDERTGERGG